MPPFLECAESIDFLAQVPDNLSDSRNRIEAPRILLVESTFGLNAVNWKCFQSRVLCCDCRGVSHSYLTAFSLSVGTSRARSAMSRIFAHVFLRVHEFVGISSMRGKFTQNIWLGFAPALWTSSLGVRKTWMKTGKQKVAHQRSEWLVEQHYHRKVSNRA